MISERDEDRKGLIDAASLSEIVEPVKNLEFSIERFKLVHARMRQELAEERLRTQCSAQKSRIVFSLTSV